MKDCSGQFDGSIYLGVMEGVWDWPWDLEGCTWEKKWRELGHRKPHISFILHTHCCTNHGLFLKFPTNLSTPFFCSLPTCHSHPILIPSPSLPSCARSSSRRCCGSTAGRLAAWPMASAGCSARACSWARSTCGRPRCCMVPWAKKIRLGDLMDQETWGFDGFYKPTMGIYLSRDVFFQWTSTFFFGGGKEGAQAANMGF